MVKRKRGSIIISPLILRLMGRISSVKEGKGTKILGKKIKMNNGGGEEYQVVVSFIQPCGKVSELGQIPERVSHEEDEGADIQILTENPKKPSQVGCPKIKRLHIF